jgi:hypothetical protein
MFECIDFLFSFLSFDSTDDSLFCYLGFFIVEVGNDGLVFTPKYKFLAIYKKHYSTF